MRLRIKGSLSGSWVVGTTIPLRENVQTPFRPFGKKEVSFVKSVELIMFRMVDKAGQVLGFHRTLPCLGWIELGIVRTPETIITFNTNHGLSETGYMVEQQHTSGEGQATVNR